MSVERARDMISHLEAFIGNYPPPEGLQERITWAAGQRALLHAVQEGDLDIQEDLWHIEQVARGELHGEA